MAIEKFSGKFSKEDGGCTIVINETINSIRNDSALALYTYLSCRPNDWKLNIKQLMEHFEWGENKAYKTIKYLIKNLLLKKTEHRIKGKFVEHEYMLMLRAYEPLDENHQVAGNGSGIGSSPLDDLPQLVLATTGEIITHNKQRDIQNKEVKINKELPPISPKGGMCVRFQEFWDLYPEKKARKKCEEIWKRRKLDSIADEIIESINRLSQFDDKWLRGFCPNPTTFLNQDRWNDEPSETEASRRQKQLELKKQENDKRLAEQEKLSIRNSQYEQTKFTQMNKDGIAFRNIEKKTIASPGYIPLSQRLKEHQ